MESYCQDLHQVESLNTQLLMWMTALEATQDHPLEIPDSPVPILVPPPVLGLESVLVEINEAAQVIMEDQVEGVVRRRVTIREGGVFGVAREFYEEGEDLMDVICQVEAQDAEISRYRPTPDYNDPNYIPDVQE